MRNFISQTLVALALFSAPLRAAEPNLRTVLLDLLHGDDAKADAAATSLGGRTHPGYLIEQQTDLLIRALISEQPRSVQAVARYLSNSSSWKEPKLLSTLELVLDGTLPSGDRSVAVRPVVPRWGLDARIAFLSRELGQTREKGVILAIAQMRKSLRGQLRHPPIQASLLELLAHEDPEIVNAAIDLLHATVVDGNHAEIPTIVAGLGDRADSACSDRAVELFRAIAPSTELDRAGILAAFVAVRSADDLSPGVSKRLEILENHFLTAAALPTKKASKSPTNCSRRILEQTSTRMVRKSKGPRGSD